MYLDISQSDVSWAAGSVKRYVCWLKASAFLLGEFFIMPLFLYFTNTARNSYFLKNSIISIFTDQTFLCKAEPTKIPKFSEKISVYAWMCVYVCVHPSPFPNIAKTMVCYLLIFQAEGMENQKSPLSTVIQSGVGQKEKNKYRILTYICRIWKNGYRQSYLQGRDTDTDVENGRVDAKGERGRVGWIGRLGLTLYTMDTMYKIDN